MEGNNYLKRSEVVRFSYDPSHSIKLELSMDDHTKDYAKSSLYQLWKNSWNDNLTLGNGTCITCCISLPPP
jgi:hypothetical protein